MRFSYHLNRILCSTSNRSWNSLVQSTEIRWYNLQEFLHKGNCKTEKEMYTEILRRLRDGVRRKRPTNGEPKGAFSFTKMLQLTGRFWSRISLQRTMWQQRSISHTHLTCLQLIFTCSLDWNQHWREGAFVMILKSFRMRRKSWKGVHRIAPRCFQRLYSRWQKSIVAQGDYFKEV